MMFAMWACWLREGPTIFPTMLMIMIALQETADIRMPTRHGWFQLLFEEVGAELHAHTLLLGSCINPITPKPLIAPIRSSPPMFVNLQLIQFDSGASDFPTPHFAMKPLNRSRWRICMLGCAGKASVVDASSFRPSPSSPSGGVNAQPRPYTPRFAAQAPGIAVPNRWQKDCRSVL